MKPPNLWAKYAHSAYGWDTKIQSTGRLGDTLTMKDFTLREVRTLGLALTLLVSSGCTSEQLYDYARDTGRNKADCDALISYDERVRCEEAFAKDYEQYELEREALNLNSTVDIEEPLGR